MTDQPRPQHDEDPEELAWDAEGGRIADGHTQVAGDQDALDDRTIPRSRPEDSDPLAGNWQHVPADGAPSAIISQSLAPQLELSEPAKPGQPVPDNDLNPLDLPPQGSPQQEPPPGGPAPEDRIPADLPLHMEGTAQPGVGTPPPGAQPAYEEQATPGSQSAYAQPTPGSQSAYAQPTPQPPGQQPPYVQATPPPGPWGQADSQQYQQPPFAQQHQQMAPGQPYGQQPPWAGQQMTPDEVTWAGAAHWLALLTGFIGPLIIMLTKGEQSRRVRAEAVESLNFEITLIIAYLVSGLLSFVVIGTIGFVVLPILDIIFRILATLAVSKGETYRYPFAIRMIN